MNSLQTLTAKRWDYGPTFAQNSFAKLFDIALPRLEGYQSDLGWDAIRLSRAVPGDLFMWGWRTLGTHMVHVYSHADKANVEGLRAARDFVKMGGTVPPENWHLVWITKKHGNGLSCEGHVWRLLEGSPVDFTEAQRVSEALRLLDFNAALASAAAAKLYEDVR